MEGLRYKQVEGSITDVDFTKRFVKGVWNKYGYKDSDGDISVMGMASKSIQERGPQGKNLIQMLRQHNSDLLLGKPTELFEGKEGLVGGGYLSETSYGLDTIKLLDDGVLDSWSIGFRVMKGDWDKEQNAFMLKEIMLYEGSLVTFAANDMSRVTDIKSVDKDQVTRLVERLGVTMKAMKKGTYTDDTFFKLEFEIEQMKSILSLYMQSEVKEPPYKAFLEDDPREKEDLGLLKLKLLLQN